MTPRIDQRKLNYGILSFMRKKNLRHKDVMKWMIQFEDQFQLDKKGYVVNASKIIEDNWHLFHTWINEKINKKEIRGRRVSTSNGYEEHKREKRNAWKTLPSDVQSLYSLVHTKDSFFNGGRLFTLFHNWNGTTRVTKSCDHRLKFKRYEPDFQWIVDNGYIEKFIDFVNNHWK